MHASHNQRIVFWVEAKEKQDIKESRASCPALAVPSYRSGTLDESVDHVTSLSITTSQYPLHSPEGRVSQIQRGKQEVQHQAGKITVSVSTTDSQSSQQLPWALPSPRPRTALPIESSTQRISTKSSLFIVI